VPSFFKGPAAGFAAGAGFAVLLLSAVLFVFAGAAGLAAFWVVAFAGFVAFLAFVSCAKDEPPIINRATIILSSFFISVFVWC